MLDIFSILRKLQESTSLVNVFEKKRIRLLSNIWIDYQLKSHPSSNRKATSRSGDLTEVFPHHAAIGTDEPCGTGAHPHPGGRL